MINFIVVDDDRTYLKNMCNIIEKFIVNYDFDYEIFTFTKYDDEFEKIVKSDRGFKIYLLDIETPNGTGLDASRMIREDYDDWISIILIVTSYGEYKMEVFAKRLYISSFIHKSEDGKEVIIEELGKAIKNYDNRPKSIRVKSHNVVSTIEYRNIINIEKIIDSKKCLIRTTSGNKIYQGSLKTIMKKLDDKRFIQVHKSLIVNEDYIDYFLKKENKLVFKNGSFTYDVSRDKKKELKQYVND